MGKLYVHIGLPKTATTSLQKDFFPNLMKYNINYLGTYQPRTIEKNSLYVQFMKSVNLGVEFDVTKTMLAAELDKKENLLISEEMIVVSSNSKNWKEKIENLERIIGALDYVVLVSVREPASAMFSYYLERYSRFKRKNKTFKEIVLDDVEMKIYHYSSFFSYLEVFFKSKKIKVFKFEDVIKGNLKPLINFLDLDDKLELLPIGKYNSKAVNNGKILKDTKYSLGKIMFHFTKSIGVYNLFKESKFNFFFKKIFLFTNKLSFSRKVSITKLSEKQVNDLRVEIYNETLYLKNRFNISYLEDIK